MIIIDM